MNSASSKVFSAPAKRVPSLTQVRAEIERRALERARAEQDQSHAAVRRRCESLAGFVREAWPILHPSAPYVHGWHIEFICAHLEAITFGKFLALKLDNRLLVNVPPGTMKSLLLTVFWPAWEWGPCGLTHLQYVATSFRLDNCKRDSRRTARLLQSEWFQQLWPLQLTRTGEQYLENEHGGFRETIPFGSLTGKRADRILIDDPHSVDSAESETDRAKAIRDFRESVTSRLNDPIKTAIVLIMQRLHANDLSGVSIGLKLGYTHIRLPMEYEADNPCITPFGRDPRHAEGELLFPERSPRVVVDRDKKAMTAYAVAGQLQQRPSPREGGLFKRHWFEGRIVGAAPFGTKFVRHWDLAASKRKTAARTAGVKLGRAPDGRFYVAHVVTAREEGNEVRKLIKTTAETDGKDVEISLPQDPGQGGKVQAQDYVAQLAGYNVHARPERGDGDKYQRAEPFSAQCEAGNVYIVRGEWNESYLDEICAFPSGALKDQVDATSGAFARLIALPPAVPMVIPFSASQARNVPG
jgi:predicted phage terminase large subunit-like protein